MGIARSYKLESLSVEALNRCQVSLSALSIPEHLTGKLRALGKRLEFGPAGLRMHAIAHAAVVAGNDVFPADCSRRTRSLSSTRERISADAAVVLRAARHLLQAESGGLDRRNPALVIRFHQRGQLCRRQFRSVQAKFIEPALLIRVLLLNVVLFHRRCAVPGFSGLPGGALQHRRQSMAGGGGTLRARRLPAFVWPGVCGASRGLVVVRQR